MPEEQYPIIQITATYRVLDPKALYAFAKRRMMEAWQDGPPESLAEAVYEAIIGSNENPDNADLGLEALSQHPEDFVQLAGPEIDVSMLEDDDA